uniref:non-specific serine/threonine protein kinase n=1 Tax=Parastrongyloides trichosuri TaxID=131310 RepID=A0A0N4Z1M2_PARTI
MADKKDEENVYNNVYNNKPSLKKRDNDMHKVNLEDKNYESINISNKKDEGYISVISEEKAKFFKTNNKLTGSKNKLEDNKNELKEDIIKKDKDIKIEIKEDSDIKEVKKRRTAMKKINEKCNDDLLGSQTISNEEKNRLEAVQREWRLSRPKNQAKQRLLRNPNILEKNKHPDSIINDKFDNKNKKENIEELKEINELKKVEEMKENNLKETIKEEEEEIIHVENKIENNIIDLYSDDDNDSEQEKPIDKSPGGRFLKFDEELGRGSFKTVYRGLDTETGVAVAWCELQENKLNKQERQRFREEAVMLKGLQHSNIVKFYDYWESHSAGKNKYIVLVTELMTSGTLKLYIKRFKTISVKILKSWCRQILRGLNFLHTRNPPVIHRDLKCDNIFITGTTGSVKIGDLGLATLKNKSHAKSVIGTPEFMAPEMYDEMYDEAVDVYAFGMCLLEMVTGEYPYAECDFPAQIYKKVTSGVKPECFNKIPEEYAEVKDIIDKCIRLNKEERMTIGQLMAHDFFAADDQYGIRVEIKNREEELSKDSTSFQMQMRIIDPKKRKEYKFTEHEGLQFTFDYLADKVEDVVEQMIDQHHIPDGDRKVLIKKLKDKVDAFKRDKEFKKSELKKEEEKKKLEEEELQPKKIIKKGRFGITTTNIPPATVIPDNNDNTTFTDIEIQQIPQENEVISRFKVQPTIGAPEPMTIKNVNVIIEDDTSNNIKNIDLTKEQSNENNNDSNIHANTIGSIPQPRQTVFEDRLIPKDHNSSIHDLELELRKLSGVCGVKLEGDDDVHKVVTDQQQQSSSSKPIEESQHNNITGQNTPIIIKQEEENIYSGLSVKELSYLLNMAQQQITLQQQLLLTAIENRSICVTNCINNDKKNQNQKITTKPLHEYYNSSQQQSNSVTSSRPQTPSTNINNINDLKNLNDKLQMLCQKDNNNQINHQTGVETLDGLAQALRNVINNKPNHLDEPKESWTKEVEDVLAYQNNCQNNDSPSCLCRTPTYLCHPPEHYSVINADINTIQKEIDLYKDDKLVVYILEKHKKELLDLRDKQCTELREIKQISSLMTLKTKEIIKQLQNDNNKEQ